MDDPADSGDVLEEMREAVGFILIIGHLKTNRLLVARKSRRLALLQQVGKSIIILLLRRLHNVLRQFLSKLLCENIRILGANFALFPTLLILFVFLNPFISLID